MHKRSDVSNACILNAEFFLEMGAVDVTQQTPVASDVDNASVISQQSAKRVAHVHRAGVVARDYVLDLFARRQIALQFIHTHTHTRTVDS